MTDMKITSETGENGTTVSVNLRPSIWAIIPGLIVFLVGAAILYPEIRISLATKTEPHIGHLILSGLICIAGVAIPFYRAMSPGVTKLSMWIAPYAPKFGGGRPGDPQPNGTINPPAPVFPPSQPPPPGPPL